MSHVWQRTLIAAGLVIGIAIVALLGVIAYALMRDEDGEPQAQIAQPTQTPVAQSTQTPTPTLEAIPSIDVALSEKCFIAYVHDQAYSDYLHLVGSGLPQTEEEFDEWLDLWLAETAILRSGRCISSSVVPVLHPGEGTGTVCVEASTDILEIEGLPPERRSSYHNERLGSLQTFIRANCD